MYHCQFCGEMLEELEGGGCGRLGALYGCPHCDRLFRQVTGGMFSEPDGETLSPVPGSYRSYKDS